MKNTIRPQKLGTEALRRILGDSAVRIGRKTYRCAAIDAGPGELVFSADTRLIRRLFPGRRIKLLLGADFLDAEVLTVNEDPGPQETQFGVWVYRERQWKPYREMLRLTRP